jgi:hypothetical protein
MQRLVVVCLVALLGATVSVAQTGYVVSGYDNDAPGGNSVVCGGQFNIAEGNLSSVVGGQKNSASGHWSFVGGGLNDTASGNVSFVGGGSYNTASGPVSFVGGGVNNTASGNVSFVGGGSYNTASGNVSFVGGGSYNTASGFLSFIAGGSYNVATGDWSTVLGGYSNTANADYVLVYGNDVDPTVTEAYRVYLFSPSNPGRLMLNRLQGSHPIHAGTDYTNGNGAHLTAGGQWISTSSRTVKDRFVQLERAAVLEKIRLLPVEGWFYKGTQEYHIGPYAEDFHDAFGTGELNGPDARTSLAASDVAGVALVGMQAMAEQLEHLRSENAELRQRIEQLERLVERLARTTAQGAAEPSLGSNR